MKRTPLKRFRSKARLGRLKGDALRALRAACWHRDGGVCQECLRITNPELPHLADDSYHMAHIRGKRMWGDSLENVRTLCGQCHRAEHSGGKVVPKKDGAYVPRED